VEMPQVEPVWSFEHSVECDATLDFAWSFWTKVQNWAIDADIESVEIDGPFSAGTNGVTKTKSSGTIEWRIVEAQLGRAVIEFPLPGAMGRFVWTFEGVEGNTKITQLCTLEGPEADVFVKMAGPSFEAGIPEGMAKLCRAIEQASKSESSPG
jgi:hypothetical protein